MIASPIDAAACERALEKATERLLRGVVTEPLSATELAVHFKCHRAKVPIFLKRTSGVRRIGKRWMVPVFKMPLPYLQKIGLMPSP